MIRYARIPIINISERNETIRRFFDANNAKTRANITNPNLDAPKKKKKKKKKKGKALSMRSTWEYLGIANQ